MKKFTLAAIIIGAFILFSLLANHTNTLALLPKSSTDPGSSAVPSGGVPPVSGTSGTSDATVAPNALYKDGTYTGSVADAQWGDIQIQLVIQQGKIANITFLQYPNERNRSVEINNYADPQLVTEAIQAQSATVDIITGATDSSEAFMQSLADALSQAQA
ncbi:MAG TPA: FMN-binding protein [Ktedonobacteraceae bacterium]|nr:FMN-binding protein [Ktedonobacteraceae bacterium]